MAIFVVSYDLIGENRDYQPVWDALDTFPNFQVLYSMFVVEAASKEAIKAALQAVLQSKDRFFVSRLRTGEHTYRGMPGINEWLADRSLA